MKGSKRVMLESTEVNLGSTTDWWGNRMGMWASSQVRMGNNLEHSWEKWANKKDWSVSRTVRWASMKDSLESRTVRWDCSSGKLDCNLGKLGNMMAMSENRRVRLGSMRETLGNMMVTLESKREKLGSRRG